MIELNQKNFEAAKNAKDAKKEKKSAVYRVLIVGKKKLFALFAFFAASKAPWRRFQISREDAEARRV